MKIIQKDGDVKDSRIKARIGYFTILILIFGYILWYSINERNRDLKFRNERIMRNFRTDSLVIEGEFNMILSFYTNNKYVLHDINKQLKLPERDRLIQEYYNNIIRKNRDIRDIKMKQLKERYNLK